MSIISRLYNSAVRAENRAERLRAKGGIRNLQRARKLELKASMKRATLNSWDDERWG